jgi:hypothetical protein
MLLIPLQKAPFLKNYFFQNYENKITFFSFFNQFVELGASYVAC